jgi:hypothetical protein
MSKFGYFPRFTSCSVAEEMLDWLAKQKNALLVNMDGQWCLTIRGKQFKGEVLVHVLIEAESMIDDEPTTEQKSNIRKKRQALGAVSGDNSE